MNKFLVLKHHSRVTGVHSDWLTRVSRLTYAMYGFDMLQAAFIGGQKYFLRMNKGGIFVF